MRFDIFRKTNELPFISGLAIILVCLLSCTIYSEAVEQSGWVNLIKDSTLSGWVMRGGTGIFNSSDGIITGRTPPEESPTTFLCTEKEYGDFELEFEAMVDEGFNSGVQIRSRQMTEDDAKKATESMSKAMPNMPGDPGAGAPQNQSSPPQGGQPSPVEAGGSAGPTFKAGTVFGPQVEIAPAGADGTSNSGYIFGEGMLPRMWLTQTDKLKPHKAFKNGDWNRFRVVAQGPRIQVWVNGQQIENLADEESYKTHPKGLIGLQLHFVQNGAGPFEVAFKDLRIKELN